MKKNIGICGYGLLLVLLVLGATTQAKAPGARNPISGPDNGLSLAPSPTTIDFIIHSWGNIVTTVDNHGYIGGRQYYDEPSGEWPRNSGHDYIGEIMYWMGAVTPAGDTLVANTWDEFQVVTPLGAADNRILLSTDTSRYYAYDPADTVGLGLGNPAHGWRIWDADSSAWVYNQNYDPLTDNFFPGGPTSLQESHYRFNDAAEGTPLLGLEITHTVLQWNYCYNEDFLFVILEITNTSTDDYTDFAFGLYCDIDVGGPDGTGENGRLEDVVDYDIAENLAWTYDVIGEDPGWGRGVPTGIMGTKYLETPDDIGMTALRTGDWALVPDEDPGRYALIDAVSYDPPLPPTDQYYIQCTRGINLTAGKTVRVVYAIVAGQDEEEFRSNADLAQQLYDNNFVGPQPPTTPVLGARAADEKVYLFWSDTSEVGVDPLSGINDFVGYKLYRSSDQGKTWGTPVYNTGNDCLDQDWSTIAQYSVNAPGQPIQRSFIDDNLYNGVEYWYCLAAYDVGDTAVGVDALQSGFGLAGEATNVIAVTPRNDPAGSYEAAGTVLHEYFGNDLPSDGDVVPIVFDPTAMTGDEYEVVFEDRTDDTYWHLLNATTGDTVLADQTLSDVDPGLFEIAEGLRVVLRNGDRVPRSMGQTIFNGTDTTLAVGSFYGPTVVSLTGDTTNVWTESPYRATYEIRVTGDSTFAPSVFAYWGDPETYWIPFEVWNTTTDQRVSLALYDFLDEEGGEFGVWNSYDLISIVDWPYNPAGDLTADAFPYYYGWFFGFDDDVYNPSVGEVLTVEGAPLNGPDDVFSFKVDGINASAAAAELSNVRVVPDPYFVHYDGMVETDPGESVLEFQGVPGNCTIRIYTIAGDLVQTIEHTSGTGTARWDLLSSNNQQVASGIYLYHVESPYGEHLGRFAVIK